MFREEKAVLRTAEMESMTISFVSFGGKLDGGCRNRVKRCGRLGI